MTAPLWKCPHCGTTPNKLNTRLYCQDCGWQLQRHDRCWLSTQATPPEGFDDEAASRLHSMGDHFWMRERHYLMSRLLQRLKIEGHSAIELGCGSGHFLPLLESRFHDVVAVDAHQPLLMAAQQHCQKTQLLQGDVCHTPLQPQQFSLILSLDVIEHVDADALLSEARRLALPGATIILSAPSSPRLWSNMDIRAGHRCRYTRKSLETAMRHNGWQPTGHNHYQFFLYPLVWLSCILKKRDSEEFERRPQRWLDLTLGMINHLETLAGQHITYPTGSSLFMWGTATQS